MPSTGSVDALRCPASLRRWSSAHPGGVDDGIVEKAGVESYELESSSIYGGIDGESKVAGDIEGYRATWFGAIKFDAGMDIEVSFSFNIHVFC